MLGKTNPRDSFYIQRHKYAGSKKLKTNIQCGGSKGGSGGNGREMTQTLYA
jgi:hypothetical protein